MRRGRRIIIDAEIGWARGALTRRRFVAWFVTAALVLLSVQAAAFSPLGASARAATTPPNPNLSIPLLLIHGFNDDCSSAFKQKGYDTQKHEIAGVDDKTTDYLSGAGFGQVFTIGYYTSAANYTDTGDANGACTADAQTDVTPHAIAECNQLPDAAGDSAAYGSKDDHIDRLACLLAWYIYDTYTIYGNPVNALAHSMGGLVLRYAIGATSAQVAHFPPHPLWVVNAVTVATPHGGIYGVYYLGAWLNGNNLTNGVELNDMYPLSPFMISIGRYEAPQGYDGTRWALIGASDGIYDSNDQASVPAGLITDGGNQVSYNAQVNGDGVVPTDSQMDMSADYKVLYGVRQEYDAADPNVQYEHETGMGCNPVDLGTKTENVCFNGVNGGYYLNDGSTDTTSAWTCSPCGTLPPGGNPVSQVPRSLAMIANQLKVATAPALLSFNLVLRSAKNDKYISAEIGGSQSDPLYGTLRARSDAQGPWETWTVVDLPGGNVALKSNANGKYVTAQFNAADPDHGVLRAQSAKIGTWELFTLAPNAGGTFSIQGFSYYTDAGDNYVSTEVDRSGPRYAELRARAATVGPWEEFNSSTLLPRPENLGSPDFNGYCQATGQGSGTVNGSNAYSWRCSAPNSTGLDAQAVCTWTYSSSNMANRIANFNDPNSWQCWRAMYGEIGALDWNAYCHQLGLSGATPIGPNDVYAWTCTGSSTALDSQAACASLYPAFSPPISRFQNYYDENSWQCWG